MVRGHGLCPESLCVQSKLWSALPFHPHRPPTCIRESTVNATCKGSGLGAVESTLLLIHSSCPLILCAAWLEGSLCSFCPSAQPFRRHFSPGHSLTARRFSAEAMAVPALPPEGTPCPRSRFLQGFGVEPSPPPSRRAPKCATAGWAGVEQVTQALTCRICSQAGAFNPFLPEFEGAAVLPSRSESCNACQCWGHHC